MKDVTLSTGRSARIEALTLSQIKRMTALAQAEKAMEATVSACVDSLNRATPDSMTAEQFEDTFTVAEANELYLEVATLSGLNVGGATANP